MKILPDRAPNIRSAIDTGIFLSEIYGETLATEFDNLCLDRYEVIFANGKPKMVNFVYNKVKVSHSGCVGYWPVTEEIIEMNLEAGLKIIGDLCH